MFAVVVKCCAIADWWDLTFAGQAI